MEKYCPMCKCVKPLTAEYFYRDRNTSSGFQGYCKECRSFNQKEYLSKESTRERLRKYHKEYQKKESYQCYKKTYDKSVESKYRRLKKYHKNNPHKLEIIEEIYQKGLLRCGNRNS